jgi:hypothetical protein
MPSPDTYYQLVAIVNQIPGAAQVSSVLRSPYVPLVFVTAALLVVFWKLLQMDIRFRDGLRRLQSAQVKLESRNDSLLSQMEQKIAELQRKGASLSCQVEAVLNENKGMATTIQRLNLLEARLSYIQNSTSVHYSAMPAGSEGAIQSGAADDETNAFGSNSPAAAPDLADAIGALNRGDKAYLRSVTKGELNITTGSEDALQRGKVGLPTQLCVVPGGGSYLLIERGGRHWLLPTVQTLAGFSSAQPQKGIFEYEKDSVAEAELSRAAEVHPSTDEWQVLSRGLVIVPQ